eukprot:12071752-Alexandrium_andersonii.AAC.1
MGVRVWSFEQAVSLGNGVRVAILGAWNEEPAESPAAFWADADGWAPISPGESTRWAGRRCIDWGVLRDIRSVPGPGLTDARS